MKKTKKHVHLWRFDGYISFGDLCCRCGMEWMEVYSKAQTLRILNAYERNKVKV